MAGPSRPPLPVLTQENEFFWTSGADGRLLFAQCQSCSAFIHPPQPVCRYCRGRSLAPAPVSGYATLIGFTVSHRFSLPGLPAPYVVAQVALEDDPRVRFTTNAVECDPDSLTLGMRMEVVFEQHSGQDEDVWLPLFRPCAEQPASPAPLPADEIAPDQYWRHVRPMIMREKFEDKVAITGVGASDLGRRLMRPPLSLTVDACERAVADAGLTMADIAELMRRGKITRRPALARPHARHGPGARGDRPAARRRRAAAGARCQGGRGEHRRPYARRRPAASGGHVTNGNTLAGVAAVAAMASSAASWMAAAAAPSAEVAYLVVEADGIPMSALVSEVATPRAVVLALHGGAVTSAPYVDRTSTGESRVDLAYAAIDSALAGPSRGAGVFVMAHSIGCALFTASPRVAAVEEHRRRPARGLRAARGRLRWETHPLSSRCCLSVSSSASR